jgi:cephalosporin-C deacetylase-like acetyl esterase
MKRTAVTNLLGTLLVLAGSLALPLSPARAQALNFKPYHDNGIYQLGEKAGWSVTAAADAQPGPAKYKYVIRKNNFDVIQQGELDLSSGSAAIETALNEPAMLYVEVTPVATATPVQDPGAPAGASAPAKPKSQAIHLGAAIAPQMLRPPVPRPADFDAFWDAKLKALRAVPMNPVLTPTPAPAGVEGVELYTAKLASLGSNVQGYFAKPAREGKFPALLLYQWAGVYALKPESAAKRAAEGWLVFNASAHDLPPAQATGVPGDYAKIGNTDRDNSYFLKMYLRDVRAIDYIASRPEWDGKTIVVLGTSMGGHQSLAAAGLDPRVTAVLVNEPSGANALGALHGYQAGYPNGPTEDAQVIATAPYFDTVNFASRIHAPVLFAIGFIDTTCPPAGEWIAANQIPGPKEVIGMVESDHNNLTPQKQGAWDARSKEVLDLLLHGGEFQPRTEPAGAAH